MPVQRQCSPLWWNYTWYYMLNTRSSINLNAFRQLNWVCFVLFLDFLLSTIHLDIISGYFFRTLPSSRILWACWVLLFTSHKASHFHLLWSMKEPDPAIPPPPNLCPWLCVYCRIIIHCCINSYQWITHALSVLQFVVWGTHSHAESFWEYQCSLACWEAAPAGSWQMREFKHSFNPEAWWINLVITHLRNRLEAYERYRIAVGGKDLNTLLHLALHPCPISNWMLCFHGFITACNSKASSAEDVTHNDKSTGWGRKRDWPREEDTFFCF